MPLLRIVTFVILMTTSTTTFAAEKKPMVVADLFRFKRVSEPDVSPDGKWVVYQVGSVNFDDNNSTTNLWLASTDGKIPPRRLTSSAKSDKRPRWSPDGKKILFESTRSGEGQLWVISLDGGEAQQLTTISTGASTGVWSPDGKKIAFVSSVYPEFSDKPFKDADALNKKRNDEQGKKAVKAKVFTKLFYRHWDEYVEDKRQHLFVISSDGGEPKNVTPGDRDASPTSSTFSAGDDYTFSPDSNYLVFTAVPDRDEAWSTDYNLCRVPVTGGKVETLTTANKAADNAPRFSPKGDKIAYRAQSKSGYEADRWQIMVAPCDKSGAFTGKPVSVTAKFDGSPESLVWTSTGDKILFSAEQNAASPIFQISATQPDQEPIKLTQWEGNSNSSLSISANGATVAFTRMAMHHPSEVFAVTNLLEAKGQDGNTSKPINISQANTELLSQLDFPRPESVLVDVEGTKMQMWILKPPGFDPNKKWPVAFLVHGGPQGAWEDGWSYRWNPQAWAAQGYVVALPNPRGSTGFGQKFIDEITGDWGGKCYDDLMKGLDVVEKLPYVDKDRIAAAGASFGGYMMNWFAVNTNRFKTLITHCSVWNFDSMYGTTDEIWFDEWEHGGPPWGKNRDSYEKHSPHRKAANLGKFKTPMLIIHNDYDFRCPIGQGHELFTALQRQHVPSRFINFPDEGHWVLKPKNSEYWYKEVYTWLKKHCEPGPK